MQVPNFTILIHRKNGGRADAGGARTPHAEILLRKATHGDPEVLVADVRRVDARGVEVQVVPVLTIEGGTRPVVPVATDVAGAAAAVEATEEEARNFTSSILFGGSWVVY